MSNQQGGQQAAQAKIDAVAKALIDARTQFRPIDELPDELLPSDVIEAQHIDDRVAELTGWEVLGWKIGCTSEHAQQVLGSPGPLVGRVYSVLQSGVELGPDQLMTEQNLEGELAVTFRQDITPATRPDRAAIVASVAAVHPAIELVGGRFVKFIGLPLPCVVADAGGNSHLVLGPPAPGFDPEDLIDVAGSMSVDGAVTGTGTGADVLGHPVNALVWLVDHLRARGITLRAGQVVTTGTLTQLAPLVEGSTAVAAFEGVGEVTVSRVR